MNKTKELGEANVKGLHDMGMIHSTMTEEEEIKLLETSDVEVPNMNKIMKIIAILGAITIAILWYTSK